MKKLMDPIKDVVEEGKFEFSPAGMAFVAVNEKNGDYVDFMLRTEGFKRYKCDKNIFIGLNFITVSKTLELAGDDDIITIKADDGNGGEISFIFESPDSKISRSHSMKSIYIDHENLRIPYFDYDVIVKMPSAKFARICEDLSTIGCYRVGISVTTNLLEFYTANGVANVVIKPLDITIGVINAPALPIGPHLYVLEPLKRLAKKAIPLYNTVTLSISERQEIGFVYQIENEEMGYVRFFTSYLIY